LILPPIEQFRTSYVFLTPDRYSFDFIRIIAPGDADVKLDGENVRDLASCKRRTVAGSSTTGAFVVYECQLGFPVLDPNAGSSTPLAPGVQNDGVHEVIASKKIGVLVDGFDRNVSYAYAAGTELTEIIPR
jgi:hypothetical protein